MLGTLLSRSRYYLIGTHRHSTQSSTIRVAMLHRSIVCVALAVRSRRTERRWLDEAAVPRRFHASWTCDLKKLENDVQDLVAIKRRRYCSTSTWVVCDRERDEQLHAQSADPADQRAV